MTSFRCQAIALSTTYDWIQNEPFETNLGEIRIQKMYYILETVILEILIKIVTTCEAIICPANTKQQCWYPSLRCAHCIIAFQMTQRAVLWVLDNHASSWVNKAITLCNACACTIIKLLRGKSLVLMTYKVHVTVTISLAKSKILLVLPRGFSVR